MLSSFIKLVRANFKATGKKPGTLTKIIISVSTLSFTTITCDKALLCLSLGKKKCTVINRPSTKQSFLDDKLDRKTLV